VFELHKLFFKVAKVYRQGESTGMMNIDEKTISQERVSEVYSMMAICFFGS
jgi:hypothetical protein